MFTGSRLQFLSLTFPTIQIPLRDQLAESIKKKKHQKTGWLFSLMFPKQIFLFLSAQLVAPRVTFLQANFQWWTEV